MNNPFTPPGNLPRWEQYALGRVSRKILALPLGSAALELSDSYSRLRAAVTEGHNSRWVSLSEELESGYALRTTDITIGWGKSYGDSQPIRYMVAEQHEAMSMQPDAERIYIAGEPRHLNTLGFRPIFAAIAQVRRLEPLPEQS